MEGQQPATDFILFHLAFPVTNIPETKLFYHEGLGCDLGRENSQSLILGLYGHQLVAHVTDEPLNPQKSIYPRHFGLVFSQKADWQNLLERAQHRQLRFYQHPKLRFLDLPLEHHTFFLEDPFHNLLEFKYYRYPEAILGHHEWTQIGDASIPSH
jgi:uncharacterized protein